MPWILNKISRNNRTIETIPQITDFCISNLNFVFLINEQQTDTLLSVTISFISDGDKYPKYFNKRFRYAIPLYFLTWIIKEVSFCKIHTETWLHKLHPQISQICYTLCTWSKFSTQEITFIWHILHRVWNNGFYLNYTIHDPSKSCK